MTKNRSNTETSFDIVLGFDMETDIGSFTPFYEGVKKGTLPLLKILKKYNARSTFYWTGHAAENNPDMLLHVSNEGHETGCHGLFHETLGDALFPLPNNWPPPDRYQYHQKDQWKKTGKLQMSTAVGQHHCCECA